MKSIRLSLLLVTTLLLGAAPPAPPAQSNYTTTITSNAPATLGCVWESYVCDVQCTLCTVAECVATATYSTVGTCAAYDGDVLNWSATASPANYNLLTDQGWYQVLWSGYTYSGEQTVSYQFTLPEDSTPVPQPTGDPAWAFPTEPLLPHQYPETPDVTIDAPITSGILWEVARIALTVYHVVSGGDAAVWLVYAVILLLPIGGIIIYRLLTKPPEI